MKLTRVLLLATLALAAAVAQAQSTSAPPAISVPPPGVAGPRLRDDVRQQYFAERKQIVLRQLAERIAIVSSAQACVSAASALEQLRACMQQERASMEELAARHGH